MDNDPAYVKRLENLPLEKKKAFLHGDWDIYTGQGFPEWNESIHVVEDFEIPEHWVKWRCLDNGYTDPFYWGWITVSPEGIVYLYREFTRNHDDIKILYTQQAEKVIEKETKTVIKNGRTIEKRDRCLYTVAGLDAWNKHHRDQSGKDLTDYYAEGGINDLVKAVTDRALRKATFHEYLKPIKDENTGEVYAKFQVFESCKVFREMMPELVEDEDDSDKIADCNYDHPYDGVGYGIISYHTEKSKGLKGSRTEIQKLKDKVIARRRKQKKKGRYM